MAVPRRPDVLPHVDAESDFVDVVLQLDVQCRSCGQSRCYRQQVETRGVLHRLRASFATRRECSDRIVPRAAIGELSRPLEHVPQGPEPFGVCRADCGRSGARDPSSRHIHRGTRSAPCRAGTACPASGGARGRCQADVARRRGRYFFTVNPRRPIVRHRVLKAAVELLP